MNPDPRVIRWEPAQHYDAAVHALGEIPGASDAADRQLAALMAITHALLGILRRLDQYTPR